MRLELRPLPGGLHLVQRELCARPQAEELGLLAFLNADKSTNSEVHHGCRDIAKIRRVINQGAELGGCQLSRRFIGNRDGTSLWITASQIPQTPHQAKDADREDQRPVGSEKETSQFQ